MVYALVAFGIVVIGINVSQHLYQRDVTFLPTAFGVSRADIADTLMLAVIVINGAATVVGLVSAALGLLRVDENIGFLVHRIQELEQQLRSDEALFNRLERELAPLVDQVTAARAQEPRREDG